MSFTLKQSLESLEKALDKFIHPEVLQNDNAYKCTKCNKKVSARKRFTVHRAPNVATFQLKRFDYNRIFGGKITKYISYPETFNLRPYMSEPKVN
jgi:ubiquitin carboxyl-terminal hydrolase 36/42